MKRKRKNEKEEVKNPRKRQLRIKITPEDKELLLAEKLSNEAFTMLFVIYLTIKKKKGITSAEQECTIFTKDILDNYEMIFYSSAEIDNQKICSIGQLESYLNRQHIAVTGMCKVSSDHVVYEKQCIAKFVKINGIRKKRSYREITWTAYTKESFLKAAKTGSAENLVRHSAVCEKGNRQCAAPQAVAEKQSNPTPKNP